MVDLKFDDFVNVITEAIKLRNIAFFVGAGVSKNSGLPLAKELEIAILKKLNVKSTLINVFLKSQLPFESFFEAISQMGKIDPILDVFLMGIPNLNHAFLAKLLRKGLTGLVATTNFDALLEKALQSEEVSDLELIKSEEHFSSFKDIHTDNRLLLKLHGSADEKSTVRIVLWQIAARILQEARKNALNHIFLNGKHNVILFMGYSCSDLFDIIPYIQGIRNPEKKIVIIDHITDAAKYQIEHIASKKYFSNFAGYYVQTNTDELIKKLWINLEEEIGEYSGFKLQYLNWEKQIEIWKNQFNDIELRLIQYNLLSALPYLKESGPKKIYPRALTFQLNYMPQFDEELKEYLPLSLEQILELWSELRKSDEDAKTKEDEFDLVVYIAVLTLNGRQMIENGKIRESIQYFLKALVLSYKVNTQSLTFEEVSFLNRKLAEIYTLMAYAYFSDGEFIKAYINNEKSLRLSTEIGYMEGVLECKILKPLITLNLVRNNETLLSERVIPEFLSAAELAKSLGNVVYEAECLLNLSKVYIVCNKYDIAREYASNALNISSAEGLGTLKAECEKVLQGLQK